MQEHRHKESIDLERVSHFIWVLLAHIFKGLRVGRQEGRLFDTADGQLCDKDADLDQCDEEEH